MQLFWRQGFEACSMDDLVKWTGVSRHGIYADIGGKRDLFLRCFSAYDVKVVSPAVSILEEDDADIDAISAYFETQIDLAKQSGLPGPGCFVANAMTETAPHDAEIRYAVALHNARLKAGFCNALRKAFAHVDRDQLDALASLMVTTAQGLWSMSRVVEDATPLRDNVLALMSLLKARIH
jgi:TetR/AcrR family transcriptional regulator, transcriptional repressor for nem operon